MVENEIKKTGHSYNEVMRAIEKLSEEEKTELFELLKLDEITYLIRNEDTVTEYCSGLVKYANKYNTLAKALPKLFKMINEPTDTVNDIVREYDKLDEDKKKEATLKLMNNSVFQKDCCEILVGDFERIVEENPTLKLLNDTLGISKWYRKNVALGIGCDHEYKV